VPSAEIWRYSITDSVFSRTRVHTGIEKNENKDNTVGKIASYDTSAAMQFAKNNNNTVP